MVPLDVKSFYTNMSVQEAIASLECSKFHYSSIENNEILQLVGIYVRQTVFHFNNTFYSQNDTLAMGNLLASLLRDIYKRC